MSDTFELSRFVDAQAGIYDAVVRELRDGRKRSHWMWFVFPQLAGLGNSPTARHYAISGLAEAQAYLAHPILGPRLRECTALVNDLGGQRIEDVFGWPDCLKLKSSMTLFALAGGSENSEFVAVLEQFYGGQQDEKTVELLQG